MLGCLDQFAGSVICWAKALMPGYHLVYHFGNHGSNNVLKGLSFFPPTIDRLNIWINSVWGFTAEVCVNRLCGGRSIWRKKLNVATPSLIDLKGRNERMVMKSLEWYHLPQRSSSLRFKDGRTALPSPFFFTRLKSWFWWRETKQENDSFIHLSLHLQALFINAKKLHA